MCSEFSEKRNQKLIARKDEACFEGQVLLEFDPGVAFVALEFIEHGLNGCKSCRSLLEATNALTRSEMGY